MRLLSLGLVATATLIGSLAFARSEAPAPDHAALARGRDLYVRTGCYACHGYVGQGGLAGPRLAPGPLPVAALTAYVRRPGGVMPPYAASVLPDEQLRDIHAYLVSLPPPPPLVSLPLLSD